MGKTIQGSSWFRKDVSLEEKKDAPDDPFAKHLSATVWAIVDFPVPSESIQPKYGR